MQYIYKDSAYLKMCYDDFRAPGDHRVSQCSSICLEQRYAWLVLPTFPAGSDISVVMKHEIQSVVCIFNRYSWSHESIICSWSYRFD